MTATASTSPTIPVTGESPTAVSRGTVLIVLASVCFGTSGPLVKPTMDAGLSPQQVASFRIAVAAVLLLAFVAVTRPALLRVRRADLPLLAGYGLVGVAAVQLLYFAAVSRIPIGVAMLLEFTAPVLVALWVRFVRRVILPARMWVGTALALLGLAMVAEVWQGLRLDALGPAVRHRRGPVRGGVLPGRRARRPARIPPLGLVTWGMVVGAVAIAVIAPPWSLPGDILGADAGLRRLARAGVDAAGGVRGGEHGAGLPAVDQRAAATCRRTWSACSRCASRSWRPRWRGCSSARHSPWCRSSARPSCSPARRWYSSRRAGAACPTQTTACPTSWLTARSANSLNSAGRSVGHAGRERRTRAQTGMTVGTIIGRRR